MQDLVVPPEETRCGNFLTLERPDAQDIYRRLQAQRIMTDVRGSRLRIGFGIYQTVEEVDELVSRIERAAVFEGASHRTSAAS